MLLTPNCSRSLWNPLYWSLPPLWFRRSINALPCCASKKAGVEAFAPRRGVGVCGYASYWLITGSDQMRWSQLFQRRLISKSRVRISWLFCRPDWRNTLHQRMTQIRLPQIMLLRAVCCVRAGSVHQEIFLAYISRFFLLRCHYFDRCPGQFPNLMWLHFSFSTVCFSSWLSNTTRTQQSLKGDPELLIYPVMNQ